MIILGLKIPYRSRRLVTTSANAATTRAGSSATRAVPCTTRSDGGPANTFQVPLLRSILSSGFKKGLSHKSPILQSRVI